VENIPENPDRKIIRYFLFQKYRNEEGLDAEEVAAKLSRESPAHLYRDLNEDGFPVCLLCGGYALKFSFCDRCGTPGRERLRRVTDEGEAEELPPVANAADLFRPVVERLAGAVRHLHHRVERYHARRFEQADVVSVGATRFYRSEFPSEEKWHAFCEEAGQDPRQDSVTISPQQMVNAVGADAAPRETALIAAYFLVEDSDRTDEQKLEALLEALQCNSDGTAREKLLHGNLNHPKQHPGKIEELRRVARQVARLVRGVPIGGPPENRLTDRDVSVTWYITEQLQAGRPYAEVKEELTQQGLEPAKVDELKNLGTSLPH
jgi:hypothetical protein